MRIFVKLEVLEKNSSIMKIELKDSNLMAANRVRPPICVPKPNCVLYMYVNGEHTNIGAGILIEGDLP